MKSKPLNLTREQKDALIDKIPILKEFRDSTDSDQMAILISCSYLLHSIANAYAEGAVAIMEKYGLVQKKFKTRAITLESAFDRFDEACMELIKGSGDKEAYKAALNQFCGNFEDMKAHIDNMLHVYEPELHRRKEDDR